MHSQSLRRETAALQAKHAKLKEDFVHNLRVLEERDQEIADGDAWVDKCKRLLADRDAEISELKTRAAVDQRTAAQLKEELDAAQWRLVTEQRARADDADRMRREQQETVERAHAELLHKFNEVCGMVCLFAIRSCLL